MGQHASVARRQPAYLALWSLWSLSWAGYGAAWAVVIYIWGVMDAVSFYFAASGGLWLGISQGLVLRRYLALSGWWWWIFSSSVGWFGAIVVLFFGFAVVSIGGGLNGTDTRGCGLAFCGLAGTIFGSIQVYSRIRFESDFWAFTNAFAWSVGAFVGGIVGYALYDATKTGELVRYNAPQETLSIALGILICMIIIGGITGLGAAWQIWLRSKPLP